MHADQLGATNGGAPSTAGSVVARSELDGLRATCPTLDVPLDVQTPGDASVVVRLQVTGTFVRLERVVASGSRVWAQLPSASGEGAS
jgi:hypothetical protein